MNLSKEQLQELTDYGYVQFSAQKIAVIMELDFDELEREILFANTPAHRAYYAGRYKADYEVRTSIFDFAKRGSIQAAELALRYIDTLKQDEI